MQNSETFEKYAIFQTGGKQYQAVEGKTIQVEKLEGNVGDQLTFDEVLFAKLGASDYKIGTPFLPTPVTATIVKHMLEPKKIVFKFKRRKKVRVKKGHRQPGTVIRIDAI